MENELQKIWPDNGNCHGYCIVIGSGVFFKAEKVLVATGC